MALRIKGRWPSVVRFFLIAVGFSATGVIITSELGLYSRLYGPQILLELNLAYYLPSIPVLLIWGQVELLLDTLLGHMGSTALRLSASLAGCAALCAAFPFASNTHGALVWTVALLGVLSAIAFSTSFQFVQSFRHADLIGLGLGCVGCGPLVLLVQLALGIGDRPTRRQWVAQFEVSAAIVLLGVLSSLSLFGQYWDVLTDAQPHDDLRKPLLADGAVADEERQQPPGFTATREAADAVVQRPRGAVDATGAITLRRPIPPSSRLPTQARWYSPPVEVLSPEEQAQEQRLTPPPANILLMPDPFHEGLPGVFSPPSDLNLAFRSGASASAGGRRPSWDAGNAESPQHPALMGKYVVRPLPVALLSADREPTGGGGPPDAMAGAALVAGQGLGMQPGGDVNRDELTAGFTSGFTAEGTQQASKEDDALRISGTGGRLADAAPESWDGGRRLQEGMACAELAGGRVHQAGAAEGGRQAGRQGAKPEALTLWQETGAAVAHIWPVLCAFLISVGILYLVFPFFTYVPPGGQFGESLPRVLFFTRIGADIAGRVAPRCKALLTRSPALLFSLALAKVFGAALFVAYTKAPPAWRHDMLPVGAVAFLWVAGGYVNTSANLLGPALAPVHLRARASALMAFTCQVAHFLGLVLAAGMVHAMFGGLAG